MKKSWTSLMAFLLLAPFIINAVDTTSAAKKVQKKIVVASDCTWPPMEYLDDHKNIIGFGPDLVKEIAKAAGFEVEIKNTAWDGIFAALAAGSYHAISSSVTITEERMVAMDFSGPYVNAGQVLVVRKVTKGATTLADLKQVLTDFKPTKVFVSHPADTNPDHESYYLFLRTAL